MSPHNAVEAHDSVEISPELALIDPDLAAAERGRLPLPHEFRPGWRTQPVAVLSVASLAEYQPQVEVEVEVEDEWRLEPELPIEEALWASAARRHITPEAEILEWEPELPVEEALWAAALAAPSGCSQPVSAVEPPVEERVGTTVIRLPRPLEVIRDEPVRIFRSRARRRRTFVARLAFVAVAGAVAGVAVADQETNRSANRGAEAVPAAGRPPTPHPTVGRAPATHPARPRPATKRANPTATRPKPVHPPLPARTPRPAPTPKPATTHKPAPAHTTPKPAPSAAPTPNTVPPATAKPKPSIGAPSAPFVPSRTWAWAPVAGAEAYRFSFARAGRVVLSKTTDRPRLELPTAFVFRPGHYTWTVVPVVGGTLRKATVRSTFIIG